MKRLNVTFESWDHTCADGCCYTWGTDVYIEGKFVTRISSDHFDRTNLIEVLTSLGYAVREYDFNESEVGQCTTL